MDFELNYFCMINVHAENRNRSGIYIKLNLNLSLMHEFIVNYINSYEL